MMRAVVLVLGDLGRSPRMLAHAGSLLRAGYEVHLVGELRTALPDVLQRSPALHVHSLEGGAPGAGSGIRASLSTGARGLRLAWTLARTLLREVPAPNLVILQTPPALPTLPIAIAAARVRGARVIVDWHNLGWTVLALRFGTSHPLVRFTRWAEHFFGRFAKGHLAVSKRLARHLESLGLQGVSALHDGTSAVRPFPVARRDLPADPVVVVAPMGWTRDDDLPLLAEAVQLLTDEVGTAGGSFRRLWLLVSGNGPLREEWGPRLRTLSGTSILVETPDVPAEAYPALLASSHLGLCVHRSSSQMDLPMKVVELQAVGVPVLALEDGSPLEEIAPAECGVLRFTTARELAEQLRGVLMRDAAATNLLAQLTEQARRHSTSDWDDRWTQVMTRRLPEAP